MVQAQLAVVDTVFNRAAAEETFAFGADISWLSQQESWKTVYRNRAGKNTELMTILQEEEGINAVRFRVWVNPSGGWSGKQDVINLCKRAHEKGLKIMLDFHYSDTWADPGSQTIPAAWTDHSVEALSKNVYDHTYDILHSLKLLGIVPQWVQIGNETKRGMLWDTGRTSSTQGYANFATLINSAYKAIKEVDESILAIVHLPDGHDNSLYRSMFDNLKKHGAKWDVIGMSAYPRWSHLDITNDTQVASTISKYMSNINDIKSRYGTPVIVVETGHYNNKPYEANHFLVEFMNKLIKAKVLGCFYWEPEAMSGYELGAWDPDTHQATIAMDAFKGVKHIPVDSYLKIIMRSPSDPFISDSGDSIELKVNVKTTTNITQVSKVDFYLNDSLLNTATSGTTTGNYVYTTENKIPCGVHHFYVKATDDQGHTEKSDTISILAGPMLMLDESSDSWLGVTNGSGSVETTYRRYTGNGYIATEAAKNVTTSWCINIPAAGTYRVAIRYSNSSAKKTAKVTLDGAFKTIVSFNPTPSANQWTIVEKTLNISQPGTCQLGLSAYTASGLPNIDFVSIFPSGDAIPEGVPAAIIASDATQQPIRYYDISGRTITAPTQGIYFIRMPDGTTRKMIGK